MGLLVCCGNNCEEDGNVRTVYEEVEGTPNTVKLERITPISN
jgi:hypothetical protein